MSWLLWSSLPPVYATIRHSTHLLPPPPRNITPSSCRLRNIWAIKLRQRSIRLDRPSGISGHPLLAINFCLNFWILQPLPLYTQNPLLPWPHRHPPLGDCYFPIGTPHSLVSDRSDYLFPTPPSAMAYEKSPRSPSPPLPSSEDASASNPLLGSSPSSSRHTRGYQHPSVQSVRSSEDSLNPLRRDSGDSDLTSLASSANSNDRDQGLRRDIDDLDYQNGDYELDELENGSSRRRQRGGESGWKKRFMDMKKLSRRSAID